MKEFNLLHAEALYMRFCTIYGDKFVKSYHDPDFKKLWYEEWRGGLQGINVDVIKEAIEKCRVNLKWPPSIAEFREFCEQLSGIPSSSSALSLALSGVFDHPIVKIAYDKVGSWAMKNDKQEILYLKFDTAYKDALSEFRKNSEHCWKKLEEFKQEPLKFPEQSQNLTEEECKSFRERLGEYQKIAEEDKTNLTPKEHPIWPKDKIIRGHKYFDEKLFRERRSYLLSCNEIVAGTLPKDDWYARIRFLHEIEGNEATKNNPPSAEVPLKTKSKAEPYSRPRLVNKYWDN